jgi:hypothetical protein
MVSDAYVKKCLYIHEQFGIHTAQLNVKELSQHNVFGAYCAGNLSLTVVALPLWPLGYSPSSLEIGG